MEISKLIMTEKIQPIVWEDWAEPSTIAAHPVIIDALGHELPRLLFITFANNSLKVAATRRPRMLVSDTSRIARAMHTWIDGVLVSEPALHLHRVATILVKHFRSAGSRYIGNGVFEELGIHQALATFANIYPISKLPKEPVKRKYLDLSYGSVPRKENIEMPSNLISTFPSLIVADTVIQRDEGLRYCLNDLHKAALQAGANQRTKEPGKFLASQQTIELIEEIKTTQDLGSLPVVTSEGRNGGTFVSKELVIAYAMWISPRFSLMVIRAFDALVTGKTSEVFEEVPDVIGEAISDRAWRLADEMRLNLLPIMGRLGAEERVWQMAAEIRREAEKQIAHFVMGIKGRPIGQILGLIGQWPDSDKLR